MIAIIIFLVSIFAFVFCGLKIITHNLDNKSINDEINKLRKLSQIKNTNKDAEIVNQNNSIDKNDPYWDYIKMDLIDVNFKELKKINADTVGWIKVNGTNINYPIVQTSNNKYYLTHSFYKEYNETGWVFMDYRNNKYDFNKNTILYAHGRTGGTMFGTLKEILNSDWFLNKDNHVIKLSTESENTLWQVFSVYKIKTTSDYLKIEFNSNEEYYKFLEKLNNRSSVKFDTSINENDKIITLSTCYDKNYKVVMHAKLIKRQKK